MLGYFNLGFIAHFSQKLTELPSPVNDYSPLVQQRAFADMYLNNQINYRHILKGSYLVEDGMPHRRLPRGVCKHNISEKIQLLTIANRYPSKSGEVLDPAHGALGASTHISNMGADLTHIILSGIKFNTYYTPATKSQPDIYMECACNHSIYLD